MSEYEIDAEALIAAVLSTTEFDVFDAGGTGRTKKANALQLATFMRSTAAGNNVAATTDPGASNDNTQGYTVGSIWVNTTNGRVWIAQAVGTGAAAWGLAVVPGTGIEPSSNLEQFGSGAGTVLAEGNLYRLISAAGVNPGATAADNVLAAYTIPANSFDGTGNRGISIMAAGSFANNTNAKRIKIIFNPATAVVGSTVGASGTTIADSGSYSTTGQQGWQMSANVFKYGAANSNTQYGQCSGIAIGIAHLGLGSALAAGLPQLMTATENAPILVAVTGNATTAATDIALNFVEINAMN
jgi:hypothetical protein